MTIKKNVHLIFFAFLFLFSCKNKSTEPISTSPIIEKLTAVPDTVLKNATTIITCIASDEDGDSLSYLWKSEFGLINGMGSQIQWTAPDTVGDFYVSCLASDDDDNNALDSTLIFVANYIKNKNYLNVPDDYSTIQKAINASVEGDTILVEPGIYDENINFNGKNITIASNYILDKNENHISNTIIDGGGRTSVVTFENGETEDAKLIGLSIQNGGFYGEWDGMGGGINCENSSPSLSHLTISENYASDGGGIGFYNSKSTVENVIIKNNKAKMFWSDEGYYGNGGGVLIFNSDISLVNTRIEDNLSISNAGGLYIKESTTKLSGVSVVNNNSTKGAGGIYCDDSDIIFDQNNLCNIYLNYGLTVRDINSKNNTNLTVVVDTFTVRIPTSDFAFPINNYTFNISNTAEDRLLLNAYVNPYGDDSNDGISQSTPFKTIDKALRSIYSSEQNPATIYLANGKYSRESNGEFFPISVSNYTAIIGESVENVILEGIQSPYAVTNIFEIYNKTGWTVNNLTVQGIVAGWKKVGHGFVCNNSSGKIENVTVKNNTAASDPHFQGTAAGIHCDNTDIEILNSSFKNNYAISTSVIYSVNSSVKIKNSIFYENDDYGKDGVITLLNGNLDLTNVVFFNNKTFSLRTRNNSNINIENVTFTENGYIPTYVKWGNINLEESTMNITNTILKNSNSIEIKSQNNSTINIEYSNLTNSDSEILLDSTSNINWLGGNIDSDPLFIDSDNSDFHLQSNSPCIDTGNSNPEYNDPDGSRNDMGAYGGSGGDW